MIRLVPALGLCLIAIVLTTFHLQNVNASAQTIVTAAQVNGTWRRMKDEFKVWALGNQKLRVEYSGTYEFQSQAGPMANVTEASGIAYIEGDTAKFKPDGAKAECMITMKFTRGKLIVTQESNCDFGINISAAGTYRKTSKRKPKFVEGE